MPACQCWLFYFMYKWQKLFLAQFLKKTSNNFNSKNIVHYVLTCQNNRCLIDDIIEQDETRKQPKNSFKQSVRQCLRTQFPKISPPKK